MRLYIQIAPTIIIMTTITMSISQRSNFRKNFKIPNNAKRTMIIAAQQTKLRAGMEKDT